MYPSFYRWLGLNNIQNLTSDVFSNLTNLRILYVCLDGVVWTHIYMISWGYFLDVRAFDSYSWAGENKNTDD